MKLLRLCATLREKLQLRVKSLAPEDTFEVQNRLKSQSMKRGHNHGRKAGSQEQKPVHNFRDCVAGVVQICEAQGTAAGNAYKPLTDRLESIVTMRWTNGGTTRTSRILKNPRWKTRRGLPSKQARRGKRGRESCGGGSNCLRR